MRWFPGEAGDARDVSPSPGIPRGTQDDQRDTPRERPRASRASASEPTDESPGDHPLTPDPSVDPIPVSRLTEPARRHGYEECARALADAFLAGEWTRDALIDRGLRVLPGHRVVVETAAVTALHLHRDAPRDAPRALAAGLIASRRGAETFATQTARRPAVIHLRLAAPTRATEPRPALPRIDDTVALARLLDLTTGHLDWLADTRGWNRRAAPGALHHYRYEWRRRPGRTPRLLEVPLHRLRTTQRLVLDEILAHLTVHDAAHGFVRGRDALSGARHHVGREVVVSADLTSFFAAVPARRVYSLFRRAGLPEQVAHTLTGVCTHAAPVAVLAAMPPGGSPEERYRLRGALAAAHLPQGAPTSPALANLALAGLDVRLTGWARSVGARYTRYADDLAFSGDRELAARPDAFLRGVRRIVEDEGHSLNPSKTHLRRRGVRQSVTGVVVNETTATGRREFDALKAVVHNCVVHGPRDQNRGGHPDFRAHLSGRIGWVEQVHPARGARLRAQFDRIDWNAEGER